MIRRILLLGMLAALIPVGGMADNAAVVYSRDHIVLTRKNVPPIPLLPWQDKATPPVPQDPDVAFDVEVRDAAVMYRQQGWYNLSSPLDNGGVLMLFAAAGKSPIKSSSQYAPLDILMIAPDGVVTQIVPNIQLASLDRTIVPDSDVLGFLFLKGGACETLSVHPGDVIEYKAFRKPPVILASPPPKEAPPAAASAPVAAAPADEPSPPRDDPHGNRSAPLMMDTK